MCDVNIATGEVTQFEFDVLLSGRIPWRLTRRYSSENPEPGPIGFGWKLNFGTFLRCGPEQIEMVVDGEPFAKFPVIGVGQLRPLDDSGVAVGRTDAGISVTDSSGDTYLFPCGDPLPNLTLCVRRYDHYRNFIEYRYDDHGRIQRLIDTFNRHLFFAYDVRSHIVEISMRVAGAGSSQWSLIRYEYDSNDDLVAVFDPNGYPTRYEYSAHLLTRVTDRSGTELYYQYDHRKQCVRTWFTGGVWDRQLSFDPDRQRVLVTNPDGYSTLVTHNGKGVVTKQVDPLGRVGENILDAGGQLLLRRGTAATPTVIRRNPGSSTIILSRNGAETTAEVNANGDVTLLKRPDGRIWRFEYDGAGNETRSEAPNGAVWRFEYNESGDLVRSVDPNSYERFRQRTAEQLVLSDRWGVIRDQRFDYLGRRTSVLDGGGGEIRFDYNGSDRPVRFVNADGTSSSMEYEAGGRPVLFTDELGTQTRFVTEAASNRVKLVRSDGYENVFDYGLTDALTRITNAKGETADFSYDPAGRCTRITYFDGRSHLVEYDDSDNPIALRDGRTGQVLATGKYADNRLAEERYHDGRFLIIQYGPSGEVVSLDNSGARLSYERNDLKQIVTARGNDLELQYAYNLRGDRTAVTTNDGRRIEYRWDGRGRLAGMVDSSSGAYEYVHDARNLVIEIRMPNGCRQHFEYDRRRRMISRRVTRPDGSAICSRTFSYDACSRLIGQVDSLRGTRRYNYDRVDQLTSVREDGIVVTFEHDADGNLLTTWRGDAIVHTRGDRAARAGSAELEYDERGHLRLWRSADGESRFQYTGEGWLKRLEHADGTVAEYEYDGIARRVAKTVNGHRTEFDWDGVHLLRERSAGEVVDYLFMPGSFFLAGLTRDGRHYSCVFDHLGTPTELIDESGEIAWAADYSAHGEVTALRIAKVPQPFRFLGQYHDEELGWHYNRFRYYHPVIGCFTSPDPLGFEAGTNLYRYAPNPVNWVDPFGLAFASQAPDGTYNCEVLGKCDWGDKMMEEARDKVQGLSDRGDCQTIVDESCPRPTDQKTFFMANCVEDDDKPAWRKALADKGDKCKSQQVDHIKEVQCGGDNDCDNLEPLTQTVNGGFGTQIRSCRTQLANKGVSGAITMVVSVVDVRRASRTMLEKHEREPCKKNGKKCP
ncbi:MAG TPA: RHS repeat-associated core domain-containing protein [Vicinamibacterales bacterium]|jgi:RHS repeat-associated protein|nr:RHS repeat-associated core domain-containing protein [Vicinamibacterales bacterium]